MAKIILGVTGSVAAIRVPAIVAALQSDHEVKIIVTKSACYFFDHQLFRKSSNFTLDALLKEQTLFLDEDEWPEHSSNGLYQRGDPVLHIELRRWADLLLIAPIDANTLAKIAYGLCDNLLTCVFRAWDQNKPIVLAPAMNTLMWEHPSTRRHFSQIAMDYAIHDLRQVETPEAIIDSINRASSTLKILQTQSKVLACGDTGNGALADVSEILKMVASLVDAREP